MFKSPFPLSPNTRVRLSRGSGRFGGAAVGGGGRLVPGLGGAAHLEAADHHSRQAGVCQI